MSLVSPSFQRASNSLSKAKVTKPVFSSKLPGTTTRTAVQAGATLAASGVLWLGIKQFQKKLAMQNMEINALKQNLSKISSKKVPEWERPLHWLASIAGSGFGAAALYTSRISKGLKEDVQDLKTDLQDTNADLLGLPGIITVPEKAIRALLRAKVPIEGISINAQGADFVFDSDHHIFSDLGPGAETRSLSAYKIDGMGPHGAVSEAQRRQLREHITEMQQKRLIRKNISADDFADLYAPTEYVHNDGSRYMYDSFSAFKWPPPQNH